MSVWSYLHLFLLIGLQLQVHKNSDCSLHEHHYPTYCVFSSQRDFPRYRKNLNSCISKRTDTDRDWVRRKVCNLHCANCHCMSSKHRLNVIALPDRISLMDACNIAYSTCPYRMPIMDDLQSQKLYWSDAKCRRRCLRIGRFKRLRAIICVANVTTACMSMYPSINTLVGLFCCLYMFV